MASVTFKTSRIDSIQVVVPSTYKTIDDEVSLYGGNQKQIDRIKKTIGLGTRAVATDDITSLDLCVDAAERLLQKRGLERESIDGLIFVTQTPDHFQPSNACIAHGRLGMSHACASFDVNLGCSGYVYGLWLAGSLLESGACSNVLLLAGDTISKCVNPRDRSVAPLFGDAGSATLIVREARDSFFVLHSDGSGADHIKVPAGGFRRPADSSTSQETEDEDGNIRSLENLHMNGAEVFNFSIKVEPDAIRELLAYADRPAEEIDYVFFHQANKYIISNICRRLKLPVEKAPMDIVGKYGNQSCASIPSVICDTLSARESAPHGVILSGFGVGLSWASAMVDLSNLTCWPIEHYGE